MNRERSGINQPFSPEIVYQLLDHLRNNKGEPVDLPPELVSFLVKADSEEKIPFVVGRSVTATYPYRGPAETETSETTYPEPGFLLVDIPEIRREISAIGFNQDTQGRPGCQVYILPNNTVAFFIKESSNLSISPGTAQGESDTTDTKLTFVGSFRFELRGSFK